MKLVIYTQCKENYGTADKPYWKFKGGDTYIVPGLTPEQAVKISENGIPTLRSLIGDCNDSYEEYVQDWAVLDDGVAAHDDWEAPYMLRYQDGRWVATQVQQGRDWGFHESIASCTKTFALGRAGERLDYQAVYTLKDGRTMTWQEFNQAHAA